MNVYALLNMVATLFLMLIVGFVAGKRGVVSPVASKNLSRLIITIAQPALIIYSLVRMDYAADTLGLGFLTFLFGLCAHALLCALSFLAFCRFKHPDERKLSEFAAIFGNAGFIGIPILESLFGARGAFMGAFFVVSFNLVVWTWGISILARGRDDIKLTVRKIFINFGTVPSAIGLVFFLMKGIPGFFIPQPVMMGLSYISSLCTPVSMLIIGALLASRTPKQIFGSGKIYYHCFIKLIFLPLFMALLMKLLGFDAMWIQFAAVVISMPSATSVTMLAELYDVAPAYSAQTVGTSTLLSIATMPCVLFLVQKLIEL